MTLAVFGITRIDVLSDSLVREGHTDAAAQAKMFELSAYTSSGTDGPPDFTTFGIRSAATAISEMSFMPVVSGLASIGLDFKGTYEWFWSAGSVSLFDATLGQELWAHGWSGPSSVLDFGWVFTPGTLDATATLALPTFLSSTHTYEFSMSTSTNSNPGDQQLIAVNLSGLTPHAVPEPSSGLFLAVGLAGLAWWRRKNQAN